VFGSIDEALAINAFTRQRSIQFLGPVFAVVDPSNAQKAVTQFRGTVFPEDKTGDLDYIKKAQDHMKKLHSVELRVKPIKASRYGGV
jgi:hypothetical protein